MWTEAFPEHRESGATEPRPTSPTKASKETHHTLGPNTKPRKVQLPSANGAWTLPSAALAK